MCVVVYTESVSFFSRESKQEFLSVSLIFVEKSELLIATVLVTHCVICQFYPSSKDSEMKVSLRDKDGREKERERETEYSNLN